MRILLTNDDGHDAPGLAALHELAREFGQAVVVAPDRQHSRQSHAITTTEPIEIWPSGRFEHGWCCSGTPADCIRLGLQHLPIGSVDLVMAGINHGGNLGVEVFYSGTLAAAREAALLGVPAIAVSQLLRDEVPEDWTIARRMAARALRALGDHVAAGRPAAGPAGIDPARLPPISSINLPAPAGGREQGVKFCPLSTTPMPVRYRALPHGVQRRGAGRGPQRRQPQVAATASSSAVQYCGRYFDRHAPAGSDLHAVFNDWISITMTNVDGSLWDVAGR